MRNDHGNAAALSHRRVEAGGTGGGTDPPAKKPRLLIVDDERHVLEGLALHLRRGYDVVARTSGRAALEALQSGEAFGAVMSDLRMPEMDGLEVLAEVRRRSPGTTRVLLTGHADVGSAIAAVNEAGVHRFLTKPCPSPVLARALDDAIASNAAARGERVDEQLTQLGRQAMLGTMAGCIGHEIANLVTALSGSVQVVQSRASGGAAPTPEDIGLIGVVANRLQEQTRALLHLSRPRQRIIESVDVGALVCATMDLLGKTGITKTVGTEIVLPQLPIHVDADRALLEGALINLVKNAVEALAEGARAAWRARRPAAASPPLLTVSVERRGSRGVAIVVEDNGPGIPAAIIPRLFEPYFTTKASHGGTGLGLAVVRETVAQHGGTIDVLSATDVGARFEIELPLAGCRSERVHDGAPGALGESGIQPSRREP